LNGHAHVRVYSGSSFLDLSVVIFVELFVRCLNFVDRNFGLAYQTLLWLGSHPLKTNVSTWLQFLLHLLFFRSDGEFLIIYVSFAEPRHTFSYFRGFSGRGLSIVRVRVKAELSIWTETEVVYVSCNWRLV